MKWPWGYLNGYLNSRQHSMSLELPWGFNTGLVPTGLVPILALCLLPLCRRTLGSERHRYAIA